MKRAILAAATLLIFLFALSRAGKPASEVTGDLEPEEIYQVELSGFQNGGDIAPRELTPAEIEELCAWVKHTSVRHRTYAEGQEPGRVWNGGTAYEFRVNGGERAFHWVYADRTYIQVDQEWFEILNGDTPPLGLPS